MAIINLRELYSLDNEDCFVEVSDEVAAMLKQADRDEAAYQRKLLRYKAAYLSFDSNKQINNDFAHTPITPEEIFELKTSNEQLYTAIAQLPKKQALRIFAFYFWGMSKTQIAEMEGISTEAVRRSIERGVKKIREYL